MNKIQIKEFKDKLIGNGFIGNTFKLATANAVGIGSSILASPFLTRIYSPSDFGIWSIFYSIISVLVVVSALRYEMAIMLPKEDEEALDLVLLGIIINFILVIILSLLSLIVCLFGTSISKEFGNSNLKHWLWLIPLNVLIIGIYQVTSYWRSRKKQYKAIANSTMIISVSNSGFQLSFGLLDIKPGGLLYGITLSQLAGLVYLFHRKTIRFLFHLNPHEIIYFFKSKVKKLSWLVRRYKDFPLFSMWTALLNTLAANLPAILIAYYFGPALAGFYALGNRVIQIPLNLLGQSVSQVFFQRASEEKNNTGSTKTTLEQTFKMLLLIGFPIILIISVVAPSLFGIVFGSKWYMAGKIILILAPWVFLRLLCSPLTTILSIYERQKISFLWQLGSFIFTVLTFVVGGIWLKNYFYTFLILSVTQSIFYLVLILIIFKIGHASLEDSFGIKK
jgi:lipopolysaccharide exporter